VNTKSEQLLLFHILYLKTRLINECHKLFPFWMSFKACFFIERSSACTPKINIWGVNDPRTVKPGWERTCGLSNNLDARAASKKLDCFFFAFPFSALSSFGEWVRAELSGGHAISGGSADGAARENCCETNCPAWRNIICYRWRCCIPAHIISWRIPSFVMQ
jgi:hypothetical protein